MNKTTNVTHVAASQLSVSSSTNHAAGDQAAPPVRPGASRVSNHREEGLLQDVSNRASSFIGRQDNHIKGCSQEHLIQGLLNENQQRL